MAKSKLPAKPVRGARRGSLQAFQQEVRTQLEKYGTGVYELYEDLAQDKANIIVSLPQFYWRLGHKLRKAKFDYQGDRDVIRALCVALDVDDNDAKTAIRLTVYYPKEAEFNELLSRVNSRNTPLTWSHIRRLVSPDLEDPALREELISQCLAHAWTADQLGEALKQRFGVRASGGRPFAPLANMPKAIAKWRTVTETYLKYTGHHFANADLVDAVEATPADQMTPELLAKLDGIQQQIDAVAANLEQQRATLTAARALVAARLDPAGALPAPAADAGEAPAEAAPAPDPAPAPAPTAETPQETARRAARKAARQAAAPAPPAKARTAVQDKDQGPGKGKGKPPERRR